QTLGIDQGWGLFAPRPGRFGGWYFVVGIRPDGSRIDLLEGGRPVDDSTAQSRPALPAAAYANGRWRKLVTHVSPFDPSDPSPAYATHSFPNLRADFSRSAYRRWNEQHPGDGVVAVEIVYWKQETRPPGQLRPQPQRMRLVRYERVKMTTTTEVKTET